MRTILIGAAIAATALSGCISSTTVHRAETPPPATVVYEQPAPVVVYQSPQTVAYQQQQPVYRAPVVYSAPAGTVAVNYTGPSGFQLAWQKADSYCVGHYGNTAVQLVSDDRIAGRATFACQRL